MYIMSSGKIGMVLTYRKKPLMQVPSSVQVPTTTPLQNKPKPRFFPSMNHFTNNSMKSIMHNPNKGCSSCGS